METQFGFARGSGPLLFFLENKSVDCFFWSIEVAFPPPAGPRTSVHYFALFIS